MTGYKVLAEWEDQRGVLSLSRLSVARSPVQMGTVAEKRKP